MNTARQHQKPMLVDNSLNRAFSVKHLIFAVFGISGIITSIPSISIVAGEFIATIISGIITVAAVVAAYFSWNFLRGPRYQRWELYSTITVVVFVGVYVANLIYLAVIGEGNRINVAVIASALLVFPVWRIKFILKKSRTP